MRIIQMISIMKCLKKAFSAIPCGIKNVEHDETLGIGTTLIFANFLSNSNL